MIHLEEHQVKKILTAAGIKAPKGVLIAEGSAVSVPDGEWVLKGQVPMSSRKESGLIAFAGPGRSVAECARLFQGMKRFGEGHAILAEEMIVHGAEYYLSIVSDPVTRGPLILFSLEGGTGVEELLGKTRSKIRTFEVDILTGPSESALNDFFNATGLPGDEARALARVTRILYSVYSEWDCRFIEINPLVPTESGLTALDAKMEIDDDAFFRVEPLLKKLGLSLRSSVPHLEEKASKIDERDYRGCAHFVQTSSSRAAGGKALIGFNGVGTGVSLTAMDELVRAGFYPMNFCDTSGNPPASKLCRITKIILSQKGIAGYFFISCMSSQQLDNTARGIIKAFKETYPESGGVPPVPALLLFRGAWDAEARALFEEHGIRGRNVLILGRESSERDAAEKFSRLYDACR